MSDWLSDPQLFLYAKGPDDVHLWRCKIPVSSSSSSLVVPMKSDDFDFVSNVKNHLELIDQFYWAETDYKRLVKYIYERLLLVNRQGLVFAEIYKPDDANLMVPIYIRSLDVLPLKPYIPNIKERLIPSRTVKYLEDVNGKAAAMMEDNDSNVITKLTTRVANLEAKNETLGINITKLTADQVAMTDKGNDLESKNKILDTNVTKLTAGQVAMTDTIDNLKSENKTLEGKVTKLREDLVTQMNALTTLQQEVKNNINANTKEVWMNDFTNSEWVGIGGLSELLGADYKLTIVGAKSTFTMDDISTNVRARYWFKVQLQINYKTEYKTICLEDLTPNKERARFSQDKWFLFKYNGKTYVYSGI